MTATGKRRRRFFGDKTAAEKFGARMRGAHAAGERGGLMPAELALQAATAARILAPCGVSLIEAARIVAGMENAKGRTETMQKRWERVMSAGETVWSDRYAHDMGKIPVYVGRGLMRMRCGEVTEEMVCEAIRKNGKRGAATVEMMRGRVMAMMNWKEEKLAKRRADEITVLDARGCARVLRACESREDVRVVALLLFAGIRPDAEAGEISRMQWEAVGAEDVYVDPRTSKVGDRHVPMTPRLRRLLDGHPPEGRVVPSGWRKRWQAIRKRAGISEMQDVLRHTFGSNFLAAFGEEAAKQAMGHTRGSDTLFRHYRRAVRKEEALQFFGIRKEEAAAGKKKKRGRG
jgi:hypothetical protein